MKIEPVTIRGFQCFGKIGKTISLERLTCFLGPNASGNTAFLVASPRYDRGPKIIDIIISHIDDYGADRKKGRGEIKRIV